MIELIYIDVISCPEDDMQSAFGTDGIFITLVIDIS
jgi:hypothetical protein